MYINNVGSITQALYIKGNNGEWDENYGSKLQATQVSITSLGNCFGRILVGQSVGHILPFPCEKNLDLRFWTLVKTSWHRH